MGNVIAKVPIFMLGMVFSDYMYSDKKFEIKDFLIAIIIMLAVCYIGCLLLAGGSISAVSRYVIGIIGIVITVILSVFFSLVGDGFVFKLLSQAGIMSYEIYITHGLLCHFVNTYAMWSKCPWYAWYIIMPLFGILVGALVHKIAGMVKFR